jgi:internalin A
MAKKEQKPKEILELEEAYGIRLYETQAENIDEILDIEEGCFYSKNNRGEITHLGIKNVNGIKIELINKLTSLTYLLLSNNKIETIHALNLFKIKYLYLGRNEIKDISPLIKFKKLKVLSIWENPIKDIYNISFLEKLEELYFGGTKTSDLNFVSNLKNIRVLSGQKNNITDISCLKNTSTLQELNLNGNKIKNIDILESIPILVRANFSNNQIEFVNKRIASKYQWLQNSFNYFSLKFERIYLSNNPLFFPPPSVFLLGPETTKNYYETSEQFGHAPLSEGRIIFVGDGSSGKSSLIEKLLYNSFKLGREQTNGIHIEHFHLPHPEDDRDLTFHVWDFGGQEIQHAVHKFFFTEGCLYILVLDNRKEEEPDYWLQQIESLGGSAPVLVVFNKQDENAAETADRKFLKEKYPNIIGFYKTSCKTDFGIADLKKELEREIVKLRTVNEEFPNNWLEIKKEIERCTSGDQHYLTYEVYKEICKNHHTESEEAQKLLLRYFNTIGAVTWFGEDTYLKFLHVLSPTWITQGVYKILTAQKTARLSGQIKVSDFKELLQPVEAKDFTYDEAHYVYILSMMKKFDLCYSPDGNNLLIPSAFGKEPKVEYRDFTGHDVRTYILQFKSYMPLALIHRFTAQRLADALDNNYWYTGIVVKDNKSDTITMVHADKEAKRIYVRIKGDAKLGVWEHIRREIGSITSSYAKIPYSELLALDDSLENYVIYEELVSHIQAQRPVYFHSGLKKEFNVGYLIGSFETKEETIEKYKKREIAQREHSFEKIDKVPTHVINILLNNSSTVTTNVQTQITIDIDIQVVHTTSSELQGDAQYLLEELKNGHEELKKAFEQVVQFAEAAKVAKNSGDVKAKGWHRKLKGVLETLGKGGGDIKNINDGSEVLQSVFENIKKLATQFGWENISQLVDAISPQNLA